MSAKLIIYVPGKPLLHGYKRREFIWSPHHGLYLYGGNEIDAQDFNAQYERAMKNNADMNPRIKVVSISGAAAPTVSPAPVTTISAAREVTAEEAEAVLQRVAPERLKKKTGPKPRITEVA